MDGDLTFNGAEISTIPVINRPSYFLVNNYGRESYLTILEPIEDFSQTTERAVLAGAYKSVSQLVNAFRKEVPVGGKDLGFDRKDTVEVFFMGFRWRWRPNHKSYYGNITIGYELLPLIARWIVLTKTMESIDNHNPAYLPIKYKDGTAKGFGGADAETPRLDTSKMAVEKHVDGIQKTIANNTLKPLIPSVAGTFMRAAQLNVVPKQAYEMYDEMMSNLWKSSNGGVKNSSKGKYVVLLNKGDGLYDYVGALYGNADMPVWAKILNRKESGNVTVTLIEIQAYTTEQAEDLMNGLA